MLEKILNTNHLINKKKHLNFSIPLNQLFQIKKYLNKEHSLFKNNSVNLQAINNLVLKLQSKGTIEDLETLKKESR